MPFHATKNLGLAICQYRPCLMNNYDIKMYWIWLCAAYLRRRVVSPRRSLRRKSRLTPGLFYLKTTKFWRSKKCREGAEEQSFLVNMWRLRPSSIKNSSDPTSIGPRLLFLFRTSRASSHLVQLKRAVRFSKLCYPTFCLKRLGLTGAQ